MEGDTERNQWIVRVRMLYDAILEGELSRLTALLHRDPLILDRCSIYVRSSLGDCFLRSPLHVAASLGRVEIVRALLMVSPDMCLARDIDGRNPLHVAAIKGYVDVLDELVQARSVAARERTSGGDGGGTVLHLCVKYGQLEALKFLVNVASDGELLNAKDGEGNTVLHLAIANKQIEMIKLLLVDKKVDKNSINANGMTPMDTHLQAKKDVTDRDIYLLLRRGKSLQAIDVLKPKNAHQDWLEKQRSALMVVASLIATMAFQVGVNPPGSVWQDDSNSHIAGSSVMADSNKDRYNHFLIYNTVGFISSLSVILLLISGLPCRKLFVGILMVTMWLSISAMTFTYAIAIDVLTPSKDRGSVTKGLLWTLGAWMVLMLLLLISHALRLVVKLLKISFQFIKNAYKHHSSMATPHLRV